MCQYVMSVYLNVMNLVRFGKRMPICDECVSICDECVPIYDEYNYVDMEWV